MHGNAKALADYLEEHDKDLKLYFLAFPEYRKTYEGRHNLETLSPLNFLDMVKVARSDVIVTNYGAQTLIYYARFTGIKFVDVWHGLPMLKQQTPKIMNFLNYYAEIWTSSETMKQFYKTVFKVKSPVYATGYGRTDRLVKGDYKNVREKYGLPAKKIIMIAPTWKQNDPDRSILPFGLNEARLIPKLNKLAEASNSFIIFRAHMLSGKGLATDGAAMIKAMPVSEYPDTEELLSVTDILITDWSSLVFDFLPLHKPTLFIDVKPPFRDEAEIAVRSNAGNRFGKIVKTFPELETAVKDYLQDPEQFYKEFSLQIKQVELKAYGGLADGHSTERYYERLKKLLADRA
jgi:CDP-glycerol glycerophosphotransferase (TagB/SpsB family)